MSNLDSHESPLPPQTPVEEPDGAPLPVPFAVATDGHLSSESVQASDLLSKFDLGGSGQRKPNIRDGFSTVLSKEADKIRQLIASAGDIASPVPDFASFEDVIRVWEEGTKNSRGVSEALVEIALDKAAAAHKRLLTSGSVRANPIFEQLLSEAERRVQLKAIRAPLADLTLDKLLALPVHPAAQTFPLLEDSALRRLTEDIRQSGCRQPIWVARIDGELTVLDGRNRLVSCQELGIMPAVQMYEGEDPVSFINSQNIRRRHLQPSVRVRLARELLPTVRAEAQRRMISGKRDPEVTCPQGGTRRAPQARDVAAEAAGTSGSSVQRRETLEANGSASLKAAVNDGKVPAHLAAKAAVLPKPAQDNIVRQVAAGKGSRKEIGALIDAAKSTSGVRPSKPRKAKAPIVPTPTPDVSAWDLMAALVPFESGLRAEGELDGTTYEFVVQDLSLRVRKVLKSSSDGS